MNYYDYLTKKLAGMDAAQKPVFTTNPFAAQNPAIGNIFDENTPALKLDGNSIFTSAKKEDIDKIDYTKIAEDKENENNNNEDNKKISPLEFIIKEFLSLDKVKEKADDDLNGELSIEEIKDYVKEIAEKDGKADELSLEDFEAILKELGIDLEELSKPAESGEAQTTEDVQPAAEQQVPAEAVQTPVQTSAPAQVQASAPTNKPASIPSAGLTSQPKTLDNMSLPELQSEKNVRISAQNIKQIALNNIYNGQNENVKAAKADETKAKEEYEKAIKEDPGAKKFAKDILKNNADIERNQNELDANEAQITETEINLDEAKSKLSGLEGELAALESSISALGSKDENKEQVKAVKKQISEKKKEISKQKDAVKDLEKRLEKLNKENKKLKTEKAELEAKKVELDAKVKQYCSEETKAKLDAYNSAKAKVAEVKESELTKAKAELSKAKESVAEVNKKINEALKRQAEISSNPSASSEKTVQVAQQELARGVHETNGNNDSPDIRRYKHGAANGAQWCAYFTSYCCEQAGHKPFSYTGSSQQIKNEAIRAGHYAQKNTGYTPKPGDLAIWTKTASTGHVGIVESVNPDGSFSTIEGNSSDRVKRNHYASQSSVGSTFNGFVKMSEWQA